jgi:hypothetical protein
VVEYLPSKCEALNSNLSTTRKKKKKNTGDRWMSMLTNVPSRARMVTKGGGDK